MPFRAFRRFFLACSFSGMAFALAPSVGAFDPGPPNGSARDELQDVVPGAPEPLGEASRVALRDLQFRGEADLLESVGLKPGTDWNRGVSSLTRWLVKELSPEETVKLAQSCEPWLKKAQEAAPDLRPESLPCIGIWLERRATVAWLLRKRESVRNEPQAIPANEQVPFDNVTSAERWQRLRGAELNRAVPALPAESIDELNALVGFAEASRGDCGFQGAFVALHMRADVLLPDEGAQQALERIYDLASHCLSKEAEGFERLHMRQGLLRFARQEFARAAEALALAASAPEPAEGARVLFWLGVAQASLEPRAPQGLASLPQASDAWGELMSRYPMSIHAIMAAHAQGVDPLDGLMTGREPTLQRRPIAQWKELDYAAFVFEALIARKETQSLKRWSQFVARSVQPQSAEDALLLGKLHNVAHDFRSSIVALNRFLRQTQNEHVTREFLELYFPKPFQEEILAATGDLDPVVVFALIRQESAFDPNAKSAADARGLMQVLPSTARGVLQRKDADLSDPETNLRAGVGYFSRLMQRYGGSTEYSLAAYNAGLGNLDKWLKRFPGNNHLLFADMIPFRETRNYVALIQRNAYWYGRLLGLRSDVTAKALVERSFKSRQRSETVHQLLQAALARPPSTTTASRPRPFAPRGSFLPGLQEAPVSDSAPREHVLAIDLKPESVAASASVQGEGKAFAAKALVNAEAGIRAAPRESIGAEAHIDRPDLTNPRAIGRTVFELED